MPSIYKTVFEGETLYIVAGSMKEAILAFQREHDGSEPPSLTILAEGDWVVVADKPPLHIQDSFETRRINQGMNLPDGIDKAVYRVATGELKGLVRDQQVAFGSRELLSIASVRKSTKYLLDGVFHLDVAFFVKEYWAILCSTLEWRNDTARFIRKNYIHGYATGCHAIAMACNLLLRRGNQVDVFEFIARLPDLDWKIDSEIWKECAFSNGKLTRRHDNIKQMSYVILSGTGWVNDRPPIASSSDIH